MTNPLNAPETIDRSVLDSYRRWWDFEHEFLFVERENKAIAAATATETPYKDGMDELARHILCAHPFTIWTNALDDHRIFAFDSSTVDQDIQMDLIGWAMTRLNVTGWKLEELDAPGGAVAQLRALGGTVTHSTNLHTLASRADF